MGLAFAQNKATFYFLFTDDFVVFKNNIGSGIDPFRPKLQFKIGKFLRFATPIISAKNL